MKVSWRFEGPAHRIRRLKMTLVGREEAEYGKGSDSRRYSSVFAEVPLFDTSDPKQIAEGKGEVQIPSTEAV
jgi:hypothetical protein